MNYITKNQNLGQCYYLQPISYNNVQLNVKGRTSTIAFIGLSEILFEIPLKKKIYAFGILPIYFSNSYFFSSLLRQRRRLGQIWLISMEFQWSIISRTTGRKFKTSKPDQMISWLQHTQKQVCGLEIKRSEILRVVITWFSNVFFSFFSGTTWVSYILDLLYFSQTQPDRQTSTPIHDRVPFLEITSVPNHPSG